MSEYGDRINLAPEGIDFSVDQDGFAVYAIGRAQMVVNVVELDTDVLGSERGAFVERHHLEALQNLQRLAEPAPAE